MRILLVRLRQIGDVVFTTPAVRALRERFPGAHIAYVVEPAAAPVLPPWSRLLGPSSMSSFDRLDKRLVQIRAVGQRRNPPVAEPVDATRQPGGLAIRRQRYGCAAGG